MPAWAASTEGIMALDNLHLLSAAVITHAQMMDWFYSLLVINTSWKPSIPGKSSLASIASLHPVVYELIRGQECSSKSGKTRLSPRWYRGLGVIVDSFYWLIVGVFCQVNRDGHVRQNITDHKFQVGSTVHMTCYFVAEETQGKVNFNEPRWQKSLAKDGTRNAIF